MKRPDPGFQSSLDRYFVPFRTLPYPPVDVAWEAVLTRLRKEPEVAFLEPSEVPHRSALAQQSRWLAIAALVVVTALAFLYSASQRSRAAVVADGWLHPMLGATSSVVQKNGRISFGEMVRSGDEEGAVLSLSDGSQVELRAHSELSFERATDGIRILLTNGAAIVTAAKQESGKSLYVVTRDLTVAVVGTDFLVDVDERGSSVAVMEGVIRVRHGTQETKLLAGGQIRTEPTQTSRPIQEAIAWSRHADLHLSLLNRSGMALQIAAGPKSDTRPLAFDVVSIRPRAAGSGGRSGILPGGFLPACYGDPQLASSRFSITNTTVFQLIALAYGESCQRWEQQSSDSDALSGGPKWIREDHFDIQAVIPAGTPTYSPGQLAGGRAPEIQMMLQSMLSDRFKLILERRTKEVPVYLLTIEKGGLKISQGPNTRWQIRTLRTGPDGQPRPSGASAGPSGGSMARLASSLSNYLGQPVVDRTGITYEFGFSVDFALPDEDCSSCPTVVGALKDKLGLKLDRGRAPIQVLYVQRLEKPSDN
jgi:uncharacterized protein (TIGR03435 family)